MSISPLSPNLCNHPAVRKTRTLSHTPDDPVGSESLFRLCLAHPDMDLQALLFQALDVVMWISGQQVIRLRLQGSIDNIQGILVLSNGCLCTLDLRVKQPAALAFELHGRRGLLQYDDFAHPGILFQPAAEPSQNLMPWSEQCQPRPQEPDAFPMQEDVEKIWQAALFSLSSGEVWQTTEVTA